MVIADAAPRADPGAVARIAGAAARRTDADGRLPREVLDALVAGGFPRHFVPRRWGGPAAGFAELTRAVTAVGAACTSAAWCGAMFAYTSRFAAHLPPAGQEEIWARGPDAIVVPGLLPSGTVQPVDGGFRLSGRWNYVSGAEFADWALLVARGRPPSFFAVPRADFTWVPTWDAVGMRGSGSHAVEVSDVFVPAARTVPFADILAGTNASSDATVHTVPLAAVGGLTCVAAPLGAARAGLRSALAVVAAKRGAGPARETAVVDLALARAAAQIDTAGLLVDRIAAVLDGGDARRHGMRNARDAAFSAQLLTEATAALMTAAGTTAQDRSGDLQRIWRDVTVATSHAALGPERSANAYVASVLPG